MGHRTPGTVLHWITFHKFGITCQYLSQYICLLDNSREHLGDPPPPPPPDHPQATPAASRTSLRPVIVQSQTINILRTTSKIQATPLTCVLVTGAHILTIILHLFRHINANNLPSDIYPTHICHIPPGGYPRIIIPRAFQSPRTFTSHIWILFILFRDKCRYKR